MESNKERSRLFALALFGLILACILALVLLSTNMYGTLAGNRSQNDADRAALRYLSTSVRSNDVAGGVTLQPGPEGQMLVLTDEAIGSELKIYLHDGWLVEESTVPGISADPARAQRITQETVFTPELLQENLLRIETSHGALVVALRTAQGGAA